MTARDGPTIQEDITPAMMRAGREAYYPFDRRYDDLDELVARIWRAMWQAKSEAEAVGSPVTANR